MMELRKEQRETVDKAKVILDKLRIVYLVCDPRTGKNIMSMTIANEGVRKKYNKILFVTKLGAIPGVESDFGKIGYRFDRFQLINFEQLKKETPYYDLVIVDEAHSIGAYAKASLRAKELKRIMGHADLILMSGTPTPESMSQIFHQFWIHELSPFASHYPNFYKWAHEYVTITKKWVNGWQVNNYSKAKEYKIRAVIDPYMVTLTQQQAGFTSFVEEEIFDIDIDPQMYALMKVLKKDKVYRMKKTGETIIADTPVRLQSLFHQISSGTVKIEDNRYTLDESKAKFIKEKFYGKKLAIYYLFIEEGEILKKWFQNWTDNQEEFNSKSDLVFIRQMVSGREGINLSTADWLIMYNIAFSATTYWQVRARMQTKDRVKASKIAWLFSKHGLERSVYNAVLRKRDFTLDFFKQYVKELF